MEQIENAVKIRKDIRHFLQLFLSITLAKGLVNTVF